jgi:hypothetical protein
MDSVSQADATTKLVGGSILTPNEGRKRFNQKPLEGGDTVYMQQQNFSLEALAKRDAQPDPFATVRALAVPAQVLTEPGGPPAVADPAAVAAAQDAVAAAAAPSAAAKKAIAAELAHELRKSLRLPVAA